MKHYFVFESVASLLLLLAGPCISFTAPPPSVVGRHASINTLLDMARTPEISEWQVLPDGAVFGVSKFHPVIVDGDDITTSPLKEPKGAGANRLVKTRSGSAYKLVGASAVPMSMASKAAKTKSNGAVQPAAKQKIGGFFASKKKEEAPQEKKTGMFSLFGGGGSADAKKEQSVTPAAPKTIPKRAASMADSNSGGVPAAFKKLESPSLAMLFQKKEEKRPNKIELSGITIGEGKYVLSGQSSRSTSGKSQIWSGYRANRNGEPVGEELTIKLSANYDALKREDKNYDKITSNLLASGRFVKKYDFLDYCEANKKGFDSFSALVIETGVMDLKELIAARGGKGLKGKAMRDASAAAGLCVQSMHASKMVWTDLKTENFVATDKVEDIVASNGGLTIKGIDLESAREYGLTPVDYSPEACPPEFAEAFLSGNAMKFAVGPKYDIWSLGMMLFELSTGRPYFFRKSPTIITTTLRNPAFRVDLSAVEDSKLKDLLEKCLEVDPRKRPSISQFLLHPFFTTTGFGPISF
jgi:hypothetical protein